MQVAVTGGAGFIGANLCRALIEAGHDVVVIDDFSTGRRSNLDALPVRLVEGSILDGAALAEAIAGADAVVHLAALPSVARSLEDPVASHNANATGTLRVLEAARANDVGHVILASSSSVYGANPVLPKQENLVPMPVSPYAVSKLAAEGYALSYSHCFGLGVLPFRFFNVFGPLQGAGHAYAAVIPAFVDAAMRGEPLTVHGDGGQTRDFTYVDTVTAVICEAIARRVTADGPVNLAFGSRQSLVDVIGVMERVFGHNLDRRHVDPRPGDVRDSQADSARLLALFPAVQPPDFEASLRATVEWFRSGSTD